MEQKLQFKSAETEPRMGDVIIEVTDIQFHSNRRETQLAGKIIKRSIDSNMPGRIYSSVENAKGNFTAMLINDPVLMKTVQEYHNQGKRIFIEIPKGGVPYSLGNDAIEFMKGIHGKRILRRIEKKAD